MPDYLITPKAPLIFRNGKPFGTDDNFADTLTFPLPSTIAGAIRTAWAESQPEGFDYAKNGQKLLKKTVSGPLLTRQCKTTSTHEVLFPAPADSICLDLGDHQKKIYRLFPDTIDAEEEGTDLPDGLLPVFLESDEQSKPAKDAPGFWTIEAMTEWLSSDSADINTLKQAKALPLEVRSHVTIASKTQTAVDGHLFHTQGLDFSDEFGLLSWFQGDMPDSYRTIGGEGRLGHIQQQNLWPDCPDQLTKALCKSKAFRLVLATPAIFSNGYLPHWIDENNEGWLGNLNVKLRAVCLPRWQAGTSWNMADPKSKAGKGMRKADRLVPAGSVYWFDIKNDEGGESDKTAAELSEHWLTSISDERAQDGYGLVLPGVWTNPTHSKD